MHGTGRVIIPEALRSWGFQNIHVVPEQMVIDGNFPTVVSPNPENAEAMTLGMKLGTKLNADLVIASDPDADRLAIVCRNPKGEWEILNGNQTCMMFSWYIIANKKKLGQLKGNEFLVKTIVTTEVIGEADSVKVEQALGTLWALTATPLRTLVLGLLDFWAFHNEIYCVLACKSLDIRHSQTTCHSLL